MINWLPSVAEQLSVFSINYFIHSSVLVGLVLLAVYARLLQFDRHGLWVMKSALLMGCFTALVQTNGWLPQHSINWPVLSWQWTQPAAGHAALTKPAWTPAESEPMRPPTVTAVDKEQAKPCAECAQHLDDIDSLNDHQLPLYSSDRSVMSSDCSAPSANSVTDSRTPCSIDAASRGAIEETVASSLASE